MPAWKGKVEKSAKNRAWQRQGYLGKKKNDKPLASNAAMPDPKSRRSRMKIEGVQHP